MEYKTSNNYIVKTETNEFLTGISILDVVGLLLIKFHMSNKFLLELFDRIEEAINEAESIRFRIPNSFIHYADILFMFNYYGPDRITIFIINEVPGVPKEMFTDFTIMTDETKVKDFFSKLEIDMLNELETLIPKEVSTL